MGGVPSCQGSSCTQRTGNSAASPDGWENKQDWSAGLNIAESSNAPESETKGTPPRSCGNCLRKDRLERPNKNNVRNRSGPASGDPTNASPMGADVGQKDALSKSLSYSKSRSRTTLPGEDEDEPGSERTLAQLDEGISLNCDNETAQGAASTTTTTDPECESSTSTAEIKASAKKPNVFTDPLNWVDTKAVFAWNITIVNAMTKKKEELSVYNNNTIAEVKTTFIKSTGCDPKTRLFHLVGRGCRELEDEWELRHCVRNRSSVIAFAGDLPSLLTGQTARADNQQTHMPQVIVSQS
mmetsp:Transcript_12498/g.30759  ORF Transcript_12498/g.30759 Transcript_12498/m.30759 type:complete len:297 (+) Transcript_12498:285-1175(+)